jgi:hypothetical protein
VVSHSQRVTLPSGGDKRAVGLSAWLLLPSRLDFIRLAGLPAPAVRKGQNHQQQGANWLKGLFKQQCHQASAMRQLALPGSDDSISEGLCALHTAVRPFLGGAGLRGRRVAPFFVVRSKQGSWLRGSS